MGFLFASIVLSIGLTVLLNWGLRRAVGRTQGRSGQRGTRDDGTGGSVFGPLNDLFGQDSASTYVYDEATDTWVNARRQNPDSGVPHRPDVPGAHT
ncbi:MAG: hypothetical protein QOE83_840 [Actinomycetota bacterium]|jgi:hypothetical protein|nr:hypothetical protein [Actinomycetota bacterium]